MTALKNNLTWIAPAVAGFLIAGVYFNRDDGAPVLVPTAETAQVQQAPAAALASTIQAAQAQVPVQNDTPAPAPTASTASQVVAIVEAASAATQEPSVTRAAPLGTGLLTESATQEAETPAPMSGAEAVAFFASAQANLTPIRSCEDDLRALAESTRVYFPSGGLAGADSGLIQARLVAKVARDCPGFMVEVGGHSDASGDPQINLELSLQRAQSIISRLGSAGIDTSNLFAKGYGDQRPSNVRGPQPAAYYDRRVEFTVVEGVQNASLTTTAQPWQTTANAACVDQLLQASQRVKVYYAPGAITVGSSEMADVIQLAQDAASCDQVRLRVIGQHDDTAGYGETLNTARHRGLAVMGTLVGAGIAPDRVIVAAPSRSVSLVDQPAMPNSRVDFEIILVDN